jgi:basic membrane protein A and related proteins
MRKQRPFVGVAALVTVALVLAACGNQISTGKGLCRSIGNQTAATPSTPTANGTSDLKIGLVTDVGTLDDKNFNQFSWEGATLGATLIGAPAPQNIVTQSSDDYASNIQSFVDQNYDVIITVGFALGAATLEAAQANPDVHFVGVDQFQSNDPLDNYESLIFNEAQAGYLAGIVAATITKSKEIAAIGGSGDIPPVVNYMRGYENGAHSVNADVKVDLKFVNHDDLTVAFNNPTAGKQFGDQFLSQNANVDVLFQVAGKTGNGILDAACEAQILGVGVDVDQALSYPNAAPCIVTSATKSLSLAVLTNIQAIADGSAQGGDDHWDASRDGVGYAPFHDNESLVPADLEAQLDEAFQAMKDGSLETCPEACGDISTLQN